MICGVPSEQKVSGWTASYVRLFRAWLAQQVHILDDWVLSQRQSLVQVTNSLTLVETLRCIGPATALLPLVSHKTLISLEGNAFINSFSILTIASLHWVYSYGNNNQYFIFNNQKK